MSEIKRNPFEMSLDEIIQLQEENNKYDDNDILELGLDDDIQMDEKDFESPSCAISISSVDHKDPDLSVNYRLRPENLVDRPLGIPPLTSRHAQKQLQDLEQMKSENRLHDLTKFSGSRSTLSKSSMSNFGCASTSRANFSGMSTFGRKSNCQEYARNYRNDAIGCNRRNSVKHEGGGRNLRQMLLKHVMNRRSEDENGIDDKKLLNAKKNSIKEMLNEQTTVEFVEIINANFGSKYDMTLQKEIAALQKKPFLYSCGTSKIIPQDGPGINGPKMMALSTKSTIYSRFSQL